RRSEPVQPRVSSRSGTILGDREARKSTAQTQRRTTSLNRNSPVRFQAIGSVEKLHFTTPGVVKKNDQVIRNVAVPTSDPSADMSGSNAPTANKTAVLSSTTPRR